jgi:hypothetical protein
VVTNNGTYTRNAAGSTQIQTAFENNGSINVDQGTLRFTSTFNQIGGALKVSSGSTLRFDNGLSLGAGSLAGSGTVVGNVSTSATINPGNPLGELSITGDLTFNSTSILNIGLGGTTQGTNYDFLDISGAGMLEGVINLSFANGFESTVTSGDTFTILNASALSGAFFQRHQRFATNDYG